MGLIDNFRKRKGLKKILKMQGKGSFKKSVEYATSGIIYTTVNERNFKIEIIFGIFASILGFILKISLVEWGLVILTIACVLSLEMVNTAIERSVDLVTKDYNPLAKIAKDVSAGAVSIMSLFSLIIGIIIFLPKILNLI